MSAKSKSFFMKATYEHISTAFRHMEEMQKRGTSAKKAFKKVFWMVGHSPSIGCGLHGERSALPHSPSGQHTSRKFTGFS
jgi:hypothetical protein